MKPFLYYSALENGFTASTTFLSESTTFTFSNNDSYSPQNYGNKYANKSITMASAIALSDNIYAVKTNMFLGGDKVINIVKNSGIKANLKNIPSLPLGTNEISMIDYAQGYQTIANEGIKKELHFINKVEDSDGNVLYEYNDSGEQVLNPNYTYIISELLGNTYNPSFIDYTNPTALVIKDKLDEKYAIKTGTTKTDFWTIGYNKNKLILVWSGNDDSSEVSSTKSYYTKNIFADVAKSVNKLEDTNNWYDQPDDVVCVMLDAVSGEVNLKSNKQAKYCFIKGTESIIEKED